MSESMGLFSNFWWATVASDYSVSMVLLVTFIATILKIIAILKPGVKTDAIMDLISGWIFTVPGAKKTEAQKEKRKIYHKATNGERNGEGKTLTTRKGK